MLPPEFQSIAADPRLRFRRALRNDVDAVQVPDLLAAEQKVTQLVREPGLGMLEALVNVCAERACGSDAAVAG